MNKLLVIILFIPFGLLGQSCQLNQQDSLLIAAKTLSNLCERLDYEDRNYFDSVSSLYKEILKKYPKHKTANEQLSIFYYNYANHLRSKLKDNAVANDKESQHHYQSMSDNYFRLSRKYKKLSMNK